MLKLNAIMENLLKNIFLEKHLILKIKMEIMYIYLIMFYGDKKNNLVIQSHIDGLIHLKTLQIKKLKIIF